jgi:hypoxanthine phosphoribosyltransferase
MKVLIPAEKIQERVAFLADQINRDYQDRALTLVGVLTGSVLFVADLIRHLRMPVRLGFIQASSYRGATTEAGTLELHAQLLPNLQGENVLLADDILDTGQTLHHLIAHFQQCQPATLRVAVLLRKIGRQRIALEPDYCGFAIPDKFVIGYGLDYNDQYRQLPYIAELPPPGNS